ncbi:hypothetical protein GJ496_008936 [Pomphorhynchus laevis]|nr:hypothetical protein GJ496_008936 [Pomphorhynchus laevis]
MPKGNKVDYESKQTCYVTDEIIKPRLQIRLIESSVTYLFTELVNFNQYYVNDDYNGNRKRRRRYIELSDDDSMSADSNDAHGRYRIRRLDDFTDCKLNTDVANTIEPYVESRVSRLSSNVNMVDGNDIDYINDDYEIKTNENDNEDGNTYNVNTFSDDENEGNTYDASTTSDSDYDIYYRNNEYENYQDDDLDMDYMANDEYITDDSTDIDQTEYNNHISSVSVIDSLSDNSDDDNDIELIAEDDDDETVCRDFDCRGDFDDRSWDDYSSSDDSGLWSANHSVSTDNTSDQSLDLIINNESILTTIEDGDRFNEHNVLSSENASARPVHNQNQDHILNSNEYIRDFEEVTFCNHCGGPTEIFTVVDYILRMYDIFLRLDNILKQNANIRSTLLSSPSLAANHNEFSETINNLIVSLDAILNKAAEAAQNTNILEYYTSVLYNYTASRSQSTDLQDEPLNSSTD